MLITTSGGTKEGNAVIPGYLMDLGSVASALALEVKEGGGVSPYLRGPY